MVLDGKEAENLLVDGLPGCVRRVEAAKTHGIRRWYNAFTRKVGEFEGLVGDGCH